MEFTLQSPPSLIPNRKRPNTQSPGSDLFDLCQLTRSSQESLSMYMAMSALDRNRQFTAADPTTSTSAGYHNPDQGSYGHLCVGSFADMNLDFSMELLDLEFFEQMCASPLELHAADDDSQEHTMGSGNDADSLDAEQSEIICRWDVCDQHFHSVLELVKHVKEEHLSVDKRICECKWAGCGRHKSFKAQHQLVVHLRRHTGERPYSCGVPQCDKSYSRLENLKSHIRSHTGEKPYICCFVGCGKSFTNASDRAKHQNRTHSENKHYSCSEIGCDKRYTDPSSLRKHVKSIHGEEVYARRKSSNEVNMGASLAQQQRQQSGGQQRHHHSISRKKVKSNSTLENGEWFSCPESNGCWPLPGSSSSTGNLYNDCHSTCPSSSSSFCCHDGHHHAFHPPQPTHRAGSSQYLPQMNTFLLEHSHGHEVDASFSNYASISASNIRPYLPNVDFFQARPSSSGHLFHCCEATLFRSMDGYHPLSSCSGSSSSGFSSNDGCLNSQNGLFERSPLQVAAQQQRLQLVPPPPTPASHQPPLHHHHTHPSHHIHYCQQPSTPAQYQYQHQHQPPPPPPPPPPSQQIQLQRCPSNACWSPPQSVPGFAQFNQCDPPQYNQPTAPPHYANHVTQFP